MNRCAEGDPTSCFGILSRSRHVPQLIFTEVCILSFFFDSWQSVAMMKNEIKDQSHTGNREDGKGKAGLGFPQGREQAIRDQIKNYNKTGRRLVTLGVLLVVLLGAVTIPLAFAVYGGIHAFIQEDPGGLALPGVLMGIGIAVAGVFYAAAKMLDSIPAILKERNENAASILESLRELLAEVSGDKVASD